MLSNVHDLGSDQPTRIVGGMPELSSVPLAPRHGRKRSRTSVEPDGIAQPEPVRPYFVCERVMSLPACRACRRMRSGSQLYCSAMADISCDSAHCQPGRACPGNQATTAVHLEFGAPGLHANTS